MVEGSQDVRLVEQLRFRLDVGPAVFALEFEFEFGCFVGSVIFTFNQSLGHHRRKQFLLGGFARVVVVIVTGVVPGAVLAVAVIVTAARSTSRSSLDRHGRYGGKAPLAEERVGSKEK